MDFFRELKRRNVYKVAVAYGVVAWLVIQVANTTFPILELPSWAIRLVLAVLALGFPIALVLAWAFELTAEGIKRDEDAAPRDTRSSLGRKVVGVATALLVFAAGLLLWHLRSESQTEIAKQKESIAVLPFENLSDDKENAYFASGIQDEILTRMSKIGALKVISRASTQQYGSKPGNVRDIGQQP